jgi:hypothetical protein
MGYHRNARLTIHSREHLARSVMDQGSTFKQAAAEFHFSGNTAARAFSQLL